MARRAAEACASASAAVGARQQPTLNLAHHLDKAGVLLQPLQILQTVAARQVQHDQRHDHLKIEPALLPGDPDMLADRDIQPAGLDQIQVDRQSTERRHPAGCRLGFVLERQRTLCHASVTPLVMAPCFATTAYLLDSSRPTGNLIILDPDLRSLCVALL